MNCEYRQSFALDDRERAGKMGPSDKVPAVTAYLVWNAARVAILVFTDPSGDTTQHDSCFLCANSK